MEYALITMRTVKDARFPIRIKTIIREKHFASVMIGEDAVISKDKAINIKRKELIIQ